MLLIDLEETENTVSTDELAGTKFFCGTASSHAMGEKVCGKHTEYLEIVKMSCFLAALRYVTWQNKSYISPKSEE